MREKPLFGPAGNSKSFFDGGLKHSYQEIQRISQMGLDSYEYSGGNGITGSMKSFEKIGEEAVKYNIKLSLHTPYFISLSGIELETRLKSISYIKKSIEAAEAMGAYIIVIHTGSAAKISREEAMELSSDTLFKALSETAESKIKFGLETMGKINQLGTIEEVVKLCKMDERLVPVVDFGHMNARNKGNLFNTKEDYLKVFSYIADNLNAETAEYLHCHFSKIEYTSAGEKKHLTNDDKMFGPSYEPLMELLSCEKLYPNIICESDGTMAEDALQMKKYYEKRKR